MTWIYATLAAALILIGTDAAIVAYRLVRGTWRS